MNYELVNFLLDQGAGLQQLDCLIKELCQSGRQKELEYLLNHGCLDIQWQDQNGNNLLHIILQSPAYLWKKKLFKFCLEKGTDIFIKNEKGETAVELALK